MASIPQTAIKFSRTVAMDGSAPCQPIQLVQYDDTIPVAAVQLIENGTAYTPPEDATIKVRMRKPDGKGQAHNNVQPSVYMTYIIKT